MIKDLENLTVDLEEAVHGGVDHDIQRNAWINKKIEILFILEGTTSAEAAVAAAEEGADAVIAAARAPKKAKVASN